MTDHMDKPTLLNNIHAGQADIEQIISQLDEQQMTSPGVNGEWSMKDVLAHFTSWLHVLQGRLNAAINGTMPTEYEDVTTDEVNTHFYEENKDRPLADVLSDYKESYVQVLQAIEKLSDEDLNDPHRYSWWDGGPFWQSIKGDTYGHIDAHIGDIRAWLATVKKD